MRTHFKVLDEASHYIKNKIIVLYCSLRWLLLPSVTDVLLFWSISCLGLFQRRAAGLKWLYLSGSTEPGRAALFTVGYWVSRGLEWSGVGCGSHIPTVTQITLQETPALWDTHTHTPPDSLIYKQSALWDAHTRTHTQIFAQTRIKISLRASLHLHPSLTFLLSFLPAFPVILKLSLHSCLLLLFSITATTRDTRSLCTLWQPSKRQGHNRFNQSHLHCDCIFFSE